MTASPIASLVAMPGHPGNDIDVDGLTVQHVDVDHNTRTLAVHLVDGFGHYLNEDGAAAVKPGDSHRISVPIRAHLVDVTDAGWGEYVTTLRRWWEQRTPVRLCAAPGRYTLLIEDRKTFLPFPRRTQAGDADATA